MIRFQNVSKLFGATRAVDDVSVTLAEGTLTTLLGPSGCGKTTMLRLIAGLELPSSGRIEIEGRDVSAMPAAARRVAMVFQSYALFPHMTVAENVAYGLSVAGARRAEALARAEEMLATLGLDGLGARQPSELSGGQQQRVAVARALVLRPRVLLFDEPLSNLDARLRRRVREDIRDLQRRLGLTVVYVTHDQQEALAVSDTVVVMRAGRIAQMGPPRALYDAPADAFVADFMGEANVVEAMVEPLAEGHARLRFGSASLTAAVAGARAGRARLAVRPEAITLAAAGAEGLPGSVRRAVFAGSHMEYEVETEAGSLFLIGPTSGQGFVAGEAVAVRFARAIPLDGAGPGSDGS